MAGMKRKHNGFDTPVKKKQKMDVLDGTYFDDKLVALYGKIDNQRCDNITKLLSDDECSYNVIFIVDDKEFKCIWQLFAFYSPYLKELCNDKKEEKMDILIDDRRQKIININDVDAETFGNIRDFVYGMNTFEINVNNVVQLWKATHCNVLDISMIYCRCLVLIHNILNNCEYFMHEWCIIFNHYNRINVDLLADNNPLNKKLFLESLKQHGFNKYCQWKLLNCDALYEFNIELFIDLLFNNHLFDDIDREYMFDCVIKWCNINDCDDKIGNFTKYFSFDQFNIYYFTNKVVPLNVIEPINVVDITTKFIDTNVGKNNPINRYVYKDYFRESLEPGKVIYILNEKDNKYYKCSITDVHPDTILVDWYMLDGIFKIGDRININQSGWCTYEITKISHTSITTIYQKLKPPYIFNRSEAANNIRVFTLNEIKGYISIYMGHIREEKLEHRCNIMSNIPRIYNIHQLRDKLLMKPLTDAAYAKITIKYAEFEEAIHAAIVSQYESIGNKSIIIKDKEYKIIKELFGIHCNYFNILLNGETLENKENINIHLNDTTPDVFEWYIKYFYGLKPKLSDNIIAGVYIESDKWNLESIKELCCQYIIELDTFQGKIDTFIHVLMTLALNGYIDKAKHYLSKSNTKQELLWEYLVKWKELHKNISINHDPLQLFKECFDFKSMDSLFFIKNVQQSNVLSQQQMTSVLSNHVEMLYHFKSQTQQT